MKVVKINGQSGWRMQDRWWWTRHVDLGHGEWLAVSRSDFGTVEGFGLYDWDARRLDHGGLVWCFDGVLTAHCTDRRWLLTPRDAVWVPPGVDYDIVANSPARAVFVQWSRSTPELWARRMRVDDRAAARWGELIGSQDSVRSAGLWRGILAALRPVPDDGLAIRIPADPRARALAAALMADPGDRRTLAEWSEETFASAKTLQRSFFRETGTSFPRWRTRVRLNASLPLLSQGRRVADTADAVGYRSSVGFIDAFAAHFDITPGRFYRVSDSTVGAGRR